MTTTFRADKNDKTSGASIAWHDLRGANAGRYQITAHTKGITSAPGATINFEGGEKYNISGHGADATPFEASNIVLMNDNQPQKVIQGDGTISGYFADIFNSVSMTIPVNQQTTGAQQVIITWNLTSAP